jgi:hypothetical protein
LQPHLDFRSAGGYVLAPPSSVGGKPYQLLGEPGRGGLDWDAVARLLQPQHQHHQRQWRLKPQASGPDLGHLARWLAAQPEGNRNAGLFWAANRALEADPAADLSPLAAAARQAGLGDPPHPAIGSGPGAARARIRRLRQDGSTYRAIATAAGLAPARRAESFNRETTLNFAHELLSGHVVTTRSRRAA